MFIFNNNTIYSYIVCVSSIRPKINRWDFFQVAMEKLFLYLLFQKQNQSPVPLLWLAGRNIWDVSEGTAALGEHPVRICDQQ